MAMNYVNECESCKKFYDSDNNWSPRICSKCRDFWQIKFDAPPRFHEKDNEKMSQHPRCPSCLHLFYEDSSYFEDFCGSCSPIEREKYEANQREIKKRRKNKEEVLENSEKKIADHFQKCLICDKLPTVVQTIETVKITHPKDRSFSKTYPATSLHFYHQCKIALKHSAHVLDIMYVTQIYEWKLPAALNKNDSEFIRCADRWHKTNWYFYEAHRKINDKNIKYEEKND